MTKLGSRAALLLSQRRHERAIGADWRYSQFFNFLQVSPSYRLARLLKTGVLKRKSVDLPRDFDLVEQTYSAFGDVSRTYFWEWWIATAQFQFGVNVKSEPKVLLRMGRRDSVDDDHLQAVQAAAADWLEVDRPAQGKAAFVIAALPIVNDKATMQRMVRMLLKAASEAFEQPTAVAPFRLIRNKLRKQTVDNARKIVRARAALPSARLFVIGNRAKVSRAHLATEGVPRSADRHMRRLNEIMTSRQLNRAYLLAENAARGKFPSLDPLAPDIRRPKFDFKVLNSEYKSYLRWLEQQKAETAKLLQRLRTSAART